MSLIVPDFAESVIVRSADAEVIGRIPTTIRPLGDSSATGGALRTSAARNATRSGRAV
ncbi:hypothetical protein [Microbispora sp. KK1-11]|uniref:hypothetical protein n=1 Tax=Microbispora sp. KK1-11 TaxID=2053005 RepID=UPI001C8DEDE2|nr:hypothetical protein [Microbispora sp. KK1-11]